MLQKKKTSEEISFYLDCRYDTTIQVDDIISTERNNFKITKIQYDNIGTLITIKEL